MRKSQVVGVLARRLHLRSTRLTSLTQRLSEAGLLPVASGPPYPDCSPVDVARMLIVGVVDEGIAAAPNTAAHFGGLPGPGSNLEDALGHALGRPDCLAPVCSGLELHCTDEPYAVFTTMTADGAATRVYGDLPETENIDRLVSVSGSALFAISQELAGMSAADVDLLAGAAKPKEI